MPPTPGRICLSWAHKIAPKPPTPHMHTPPETWANVGPEAHTHTPERARAHTHIIFSWRVVSMCVHVCACVVSASASVRVCRPGAAPGAYKRPQDLPKNAPRKAKRPPRGPRTPPNAPQDGPEPPKRGTPRGSRIALRALKFAPRIARRIVCIPKETSRVPEQLLIPSSNTSLQQLPGTPRTRKIPARGRRCCAQRVLDPPPPAQHGVL